MEPGAVLADRYRVIERLGGGGMAEVYRATDERLGRNVAVKLLPRELRDDPPAVRRILREARSVAAFSHPNVAAVFDVIEGPEAVGLVMEDVSGRSLSDVLGEEGPMETQAAVGIMEQVSAGVAAAHAAGIVHRDLKPSNVLVTTEGIVKVVDFGIAASRGGAAVTTTIRGSVPYVAPEQAAGQTTDGRADVYAMGCMLYELLVGRPPFTGSTTEVLAQHATAPPPLPSASRPDVPPELDEVVVRALAKDPSERFASAMQFAQVMTRTDPLAVEPARDATQVLPPPDAAETVAISPPSPVVPGLTPVIARSSSPGQPSYRPLSRERLLVGGTLLGSVLVVLIALWLWPTDTPTVSPTEREQGSPSAIPSPTVAAPTVAAPTSLEEGVDALAAAVAAARDSGEVTSEGVEKLDDRIRELRSELVRGPPDERGEEAEDQLEKFEEEVSKLEKDGHVSARLAEELRQLLDDMEEMTE